MREWGRFVERTASIASLGILAIAVTGAFSTKTKRKIWERDEVCVNCGAQDHLECSHYDHARGKNYDKPENGRLQCSADHYLYHHEYRGRADEIGLKEEHNDWALIMIWERMTPGERKYVEDQINPQQMELGI